MCHIVNVDFDVIKTIIFGLRGSNRRGRMDEIAMWIDKMEEILDKAHDYASAESVN